MRRVSGIRAAIAGLTQRWRPSPAVDEHRRSLVESARACAIQGRTKTPIESRRREDGCTEVDYADGTTVVFSGAGKRGDDRFERFAFHEPHLVQIGRIRRGAPPIPLRGWTSQRLQSFLASNAPSVAEPPPTDRAPMRWGDEALG